MTAGIGAWERFWFAPVPVGRFEIFRRLVYAYLWIDVWLTTAYVRDRGSVDEDLYDPLLIGRLLPLPTPTDAVVTVTMVILLAGATAGLAGRAPRIVAAITAGAYLQWVVIAFSYGKVDHDRFPLVIALFVAASMGRTRPSDRTPSGAAGWALRLVQVGVVSVYFLSVLAKVRYGGVDWANSATLTQALVRRGTSIGRALVDQPGVLVAAQWATVVFEATSIVMLVRHRVRWAWWFAAVVFHLTTYLLLSIAFFPQLVCLLAFVPLERMAGEPAAPKTVQLTVGSSG